MVRIPGPGTVWLGDLMWFVTYAVQLYVLQYLRNTTENG